MMTISGTMPCADAVLEMRTNAVTAKTNRGNIVYLERGKMTLCKETLHPLLGRAVAFAAKNRLVRAE